jgi:hypothetical protein
MENSIARIKELDIEYKVASDKMNNINNEMRKLINDIDLSGKCFFVTKTNNYEVLIKLLNRIEHKPIEDCEDIDLPNLEYTAIKISKYTSSKGIIDYSISNDVEYIYPDKIINEITEEEFVSYFTNVNKEISNLLD